MPTNKCVTNTRLGSEREKKKYQQKVKCYKVELKAEYSLLWKNEAIQVKTVQYSYGKNLASWQSGDAQVQVN